MTDIDTSRLRALAEAADHGPWQVVEDKHPHYRGGFHTERRIFTAWDHPQLKGPLPIANTSVGIPEKAGDPARHMGSISEENAAYIAAANPATMSALLDRLEALEQKCILYSASLKQADARLEAVEVDAKRYQYLKDTTTAIRDHETGERIECTPAQFEAAIDAALSASEGAKQ